MVARSVVRPGLTSIAVLLALCALPRPARAVPTVTVSAEAPLASEAGPSPGVFLFTRTGETGSELTVSFSLGGSAASGADYVMWETVARFEPGCSAARVAVLTLNDTVPEADETIVLTLSAGAGYAVGAPSSATVTLQDPTTVGRTGVYGLPDQNYSGGAYLDAYYDGTDLVIRAEIANSAFSWEAAILLNTDQDMATGDFRPGHVAGQEYKVDAWLGWFPSAVLYRLPTTPPDLGVQWEDSETPVLDGFVQSENEHCYTFRIPLAALGWPAAVDVFMLTQSGVRDRVPAYGALNTASGKVVVRRPGVTRKIVAADPLGDSAGVYDIVGATFTTIADQFAVDLEFGQDVDQGYLDGASGWLMFDSDASVMTGPFAMYSAIPSWCADIQIAFDRILGARLWNETSTSSVLWGAPINDGGHERSGRHVRLTSSLSVFDALMRFLGMPMPTPIRYPTDGAMMVQVAVTSYLDTNDLIPGGGLALDTRTGQNAAALTWEADKTVSASDPLDFPGISGADITQIDAEVVDGKLVLRGVLSTWLNTDMDNYFLIALDTDMNAATGIPFDNYWEGGPTIGADYIYYVYSWDAYSSVGYGANMIHPDGSMTTHDGNLSVQVVSNAGHPGSFTVTLSLPAIGSPRPTLRLYMLASRGLTEEPTDVAPPQPMVISLSPPRIDTSLWTVDRTGTITETVALRQYDLKRTSDNGLLQGKTISYKIDGTEVGTAVTDAGGDSALNWTITEGPATRTLTAAFAGDAAYNPSSATAALTCQSWTTKMVSFNRTARITDRTELKCRLLRSDNAPLYGKGIAFYIDGTFVIGRNTNVDGYASYPFYDIPDGSGAGVRTILSEWAGNGGYLPISKTATLTVLKAIPSPSLLSQSLKQRGIANLYAYFRRLYDYKKQEGKPVSFRIDGTWIADVTTGTGSDAGVARYLHPTTGLGLGTHTIRVAFAGDAWVDAGYGEANMTIY